MNESNISLYNCVLQISESEGTNLCSDVWLLQEFVLYTLQTANYILVLLQLPINVGYKHGHTETMLDT